MNKNIEKAIHLMEDKYGDSCDFSREKISEIVINSASLLSVWLSAEKKSVKQSYEIELHDKDGIIVETFHGITKDNLIESVSDLLINKNKVYSTIVLNSFAHDGHNKTTNKLGEIEIS